MRSYRRAWEAIEILMYGILVYTTLATTLAAASRTQIVIDIDDDLVRWVFSLRGAGVMLGMAVLHAFSV